MNKRVVNFMLSCAMASVLVACGKSNGDQFLGEWTKVRGMGPDTVRIDKSGDNFVVHNIASPNSERTEPAVLQGDSLLVSGGMAYLAIIDPKSGHLMMPGVEMKRAGKGTNQ
ncbi:hypothetical protein [Burkholderia alba]|uniref:hypothetical protein n=1 Tax=Burkholderia alba TaxID=2683677 RepID=UPI002B05DF40|nr:hypothetical protein [Burkholderia alba]